MFTHTEQKKVSWALRLLPFGLLVLNHSGLGLPWLCGVYLLSALSPSTVQAAPQLIAFQGRLTDSSNSPRNETLSMAFRYISRIPSGGAALERRPKPAGSNPMASFS